MDVPGLQEAIARQRAGWSLEQRFYTNSDIFEFERRTWLADQWFVLGHASELPEPGSHMVRDILGESIIVVRGPDNGIQAFFNVCRHRGARICQRDGKASSLTCPYHAWSYGLDGTLRAAPAMSKDVDFRSLSLRPVPVAELGGIVLGSLNADPHSLSTVREQAAAMLPYHGIPNARIAARRSYPTAANWKLVMENFVECYHCYPAHPEYCRVMSHVAFVARKATPEVLAQAQQDQERWLREEADPQSPAGDILPDFARRAQQVISRAPIGGGRKTQSEDGQPVAPLMGQQRKFDGGYGTFGVAPFVGLFMLNDHAVLFQFLPTAAQQTDVIITWLVDGRAADTDVDVERMTWLWHETTLQDKAIVELNAAGVRSRAYVPGPYSELETGPANLVSKYLEGLSSHLGLSG